MSKYQVKSTLGAVLIPLNNSVERTHAIHSVVPAAEIAKVRKQAQLSTLWFPGVSVVVRLHNGKEIFRAIRSTNFRARATSLLGPGCIRLESVAIASGAMKLHGLIGHKQGETKV